MDDLVDLGFNEPLGYQDIDLSGGIMPNISQNDSAMLNFEAVQDWASELNTMPLAIDIPTVPSPRQPIGTVSGGFYNEPIEISPHRDDYELFKNEEDLKDLFIAQPHVNVAKQDFERVLQGDYVNPADLFPLEREAGLAPADEVHVKVEKPQAPLSRKTPVQADEQSIHAPDLEPPKEAAEPRSRRGPRDSTKFFDAVRERFPRPSDLAKGLAEVGCAGDVNTDDLVRCLSKITRYRIEKKLRSGLKLDKQTENTKSFIDRIYGNMRAERCYKKKAERKQKDVQSSKRAKSILKESLQVISNRYTADTELQKYVMNQMQSALGLLDATSKERSSVVAENKDADLRKKVEETKVLISADTNEEEVKRRISMLHENLQQGLDTMRLEDLTEELARIARLVEEDEARMVEIEDNCLLLVNSKLIQPKSYNGPKSDPDRSRMESYEERLKTFENWPHEGNELLRKTLFASNGFYCMRHFLWNDSVVCCSCGLQLCRFDKNEDITATHLHNSPNCTFTRNSGKSRNK